MADSNPLKKKPTGGTILLACTCAHEYQDRKYGRGVRVHNRKCNTKEAGDWRCTVCCKTR